MAKETPKKSGILIVVLAVVIIALVGVILYLVLSRGDNDSQNQTITAEQSESKRDVVVTEENVEEVIAQMDEEDYVPPGYYTTTMNSDWHFATGDSPSSDAYVANVVENTNDVYFDVFLTGDEENPIYESPILPRGSHITGITLNTKLDAGTYDGIVVYHLIDEDQNTISTVSFTVTIYIEK